MSDGVIIKIKGDDSSYKKTLNSLGKVTKASMADIKAGIDLATGAMQKFVDVAGKGINYNAQIEQLTTSFEVMTGSAEKAAEVVERLRIMGAETPFEMTDLAGTVQMLMQYGFAADEAIDRMSMLGDIAQGNKDAMTSIAMGYAQMSSAGKVNLQDIKQMINGGFNPLQEISERTGESMASLYERISKGTLSVDEITESMRYATSEGGKFFQSMEKQSQTLSGQLSTLKDNADQLLGSLTEGLSDELRTEILPLANEMIGELQGAFAEGGVQGLIDNATAMIPDLLNMMSGEIEGAISGLSKWLPKGATALMKAVPGAIRGASSVIPQVTTALFETASLVISDLVGMLPELVPAVLSGIGDMTLAILDGAGSLISGLFTGIEQMFHQGQTKIAGIWVDDADIAKYDYKIDMTIDTKSAENEITTAYNDIRTALDTDLLNDKQRDEILGMIDKDYQTIYDKLIEFSVPPADAEVLAANITAASDAIRNELDALNLEVDGQTLYKWMVQANDSRIALRMILESQGLNDEDIAAVQQVFDTMHGRIKDATPNIAEEIYAELTDGLTDDPTALKAKVKSYIETQDKAIDEAYNEAVAKLDPADGDYAEKLATLNDDYAAAKADLQTIGADLDTLVDTLAGASTATVQSKYQLLADVETQVNGLSKRIDELAGKAAEAGLTAYNVVRSGAQADEATISQAISYKISEFKIDEQAAEDAYAAARDELNARLTASDPSERISVDEYNELLYEAEGVKNAAIQSAREGMENAITAVFSGIAESEGNVEKLGEMLGLVGAKVEIEEFFAAVAENGGEISADAATALVKSIAGPLGDALNTKSIMRAIELGDEYNFRNLLSEAITKVDFSIDSNVESVLGGKVATAWGAALEKGVFAGTKFDTSDATEQLAALLTGSVDDVVEIAAPVVEESGEEVATTFADAVTENVDEVSEAGSITADTLDTELAKAVRAARARGEEAGVAFAGGYKRTMMIRSPSRVMKQLGGYTGEGLEIGLRESMQRAVATAKQLTGQIVTAADFPRTTNINYSGLQQEIIAASAQTATPVLLDGVQIAEIQGHNNSVQLAWQNTRAAKGVGSR